MRERTLLPDLSLRPYSPLDLSLMQAWYEQAGASCFKTQAMGSRSLRQALPDLCRGIPGLALLVPGHGRPIGFISGETRRTAGGAVLWIRLLFIEQSERRHGYGRAAVSRFLAPYSGDSVITRALLAVDGDNRIGRLFWKAQGFVEHRVVQASGDVRHPVCILKWERNAP
jgi:GNAT superfamily N-acetyltransferase